MTEERTRPDGGQPAPAERDVRRAGDDPPGAPDHSAVEDLLPRLLDGVDSVGTGYLVRARLSDDDPSHAAERLVEALERKVSVVGSTLEAGLDPANPQLDVLIECDHTMSQVATALARVAPVDGAVVVDVADDCDRVLEAQAEAEAADAANANDVFNELQDQVSQQDYDQVVEELEDVSFPGGPDPDEEVDLEAETGVELSDDGTVDLDGEDAVGTIDLEGEGGSMDTDDVSAKDLFGEGDDEDGEEESEPAAADENRISEAIAEVEAASEDAGEAADDAGEDPTSAGTPADGDGEATGGDATDGTGTADDAAPSGDAPAAGATETAERPPGDDGTAPAGEPDDEGTATAPAATPSASADGGGQRAAAPPAGDVDRMVDALVTALESGDVGAERRERLREALGIESNHDLDVRLEYVQKRVDNLAAYTDAWEAFLAEEGSGDEFIDDVHEELAALRERVEGLGGGDDERLAAIERRLDDLESGRDEDVARLDTRIDSTEADVEQRLERIEGELSALQESVEGFAEWRDSVADVLSPD